MESGYGPIARPVTPSGWRAKDRRPLSWRRGTQRLETGNRLLNFVGDQDRQATVLLRVLNMAQRVDHGPPPRPGWD